MARLFLAQSTIAVSTALRAAHRLSLGALLCSAFAFSCSDENEPSPGDPTGDAGPSDTDTDHSDTDTDHSDTDTDHSDTDTDHSDTDHGDGGLGNGDGGVGGEDDGGTGGPGDPPSDCLPTDAVFEWPSPQSAEVPEDPAWKSTLELPYDAFFSPPQGDFLEGMSWVKFIVLTSEPDRIYYHSATEHPFHYEFATEFIPQFEGMTRAQFDAVTLRNDGREALLGAVLVPTNSFVHPEYGVQLVSNDDLHPELVEAILLAVADSVAAPGGTNAFYFPSGMSAECLDGKLADYAERGIALGSVDRWLTGDACYAPGWAVGKLVALPGAEIDAAYLDGRLTPNDVLLITDTAPAELPYVAGILTLEPSTPNAHSAILARSYGVPFAYVRDADAVAAAEELTGKHVVVSTSGAAGRDPFDLYFSNCDVRFIDVDDLTEEQLDEIRELSTPPLLEVSAKQSAGAFTVPADGLVPADIVRVGGKAANFGLLRAAAPDDTPTPAIALTFDLWDAFMDQPASGGSLRQEIAARLAEHTWPADFRELDVTLRGVRDLIEDAPFPEELRTSVIDALQDFDPETRIRFRSSTNVEDSETFTGAGLYDSVTGCLADDLDEDDTGPSRCNPEQSGERGIFRAIQRVYASFYFRNAYIERLRRGVNEAEVGMGVLVHYSAPDVNELANGVAVLNVQDGYLYAELVSQTGAISVTNPDGSALPEQVRVDRSPGNPDYLSTLRTSSLLPLGAYVLDYETDYTELMTLFERAADEYAAATGKTPPFSLDFEYKKLTPGVLSLRQVRPLPMPDTTRDVTPFFVAEPQKLCQYGSETVDGFAAHRLKTRLALSANSVRLTPEQLAAQLYTDLNVEYLPAGDVITLEGDPANFSGAAHSVEQNGDQVTLVDAWTTPEATFALRTRLTARAARNESPVLTPADFYYALTASYAAPMPYLEFSLEEMDLVPATRTEEAAELWAYCPEDITITDDFPHIEATFSGPDGLTIETAYWYPPSPRGVTAGYTAPAIKWDRTTISGLTTSPIVLTGYFSQTYAPKHHNFAGDYVFDPRLEPDLPEATRAELDAADIAYLVVIDQIDLGSTIWVVGLDGNLRRL